MAIEVKKLNIPLPFKEIGDLLYQTYFNDYKESGALQWNEKYAEIYFNAWVLPKSDELIFGAWDGDKLVGLTVGHKEQIVVDNEFEIKATNIGLTAVHPDYRKQGIATQLVQNLIENARKFNYDMVFSMIQKGKHGDAVLKKFNFIKMGKHEHLVKIMGKYGVKILKEYRGLNPVLAKLAETLYSKIPEDKIIGTLREGKIPDDVPRIVEIINSYRTRVPLARIYSQETYIKDVQGSSKLREVFGEPWGLTWYVLEKDDKVMATITSRIEITTFPKGSAPVALLGNFGCDESLSHEEKKGFLAEVVRKIQKNFPDVFICQITSLQHEEKVFKDLNFTDDQESYMFMLLPLTEKAQEIPNRYKKIKKFSLSYYR